MSRAAVGASADRDRWLGAFRAAGTAMPLAREVDVTGFDPRADLDRRAARWSHHFETVHLPDVLAFGVALADVEIEAWGRDDAVVATQAYEDRRFLLGDRLVHWAVPASFGSSHPEAATLRSRLLELGDVHRPAPLLTAEEGLHPPGEDSFGPLDVGLRIGLPPAAVWNDLAAAHPGTARLWRDLAGRTSQQPVVAGDDEGGADRRRVLDRFVDRGLDLR